MISLRPEDQPPQLRRGGRDARRRYGVQLHYEEGDGKGGDRPDSTRRRLLDAHSIAEEFYREQLSAPIGEIGRRFLTERGFDQAAAEHFGVGFAPEGWDSLTSVLRGRGFTEEEPHRQRARLPGPARRLRPLPRAPRVADPRHHRQDHRLRGAAPARVRPGPRHPNTPETAIYHKSSVLYGLDLARKEIASSTAWWSSRIHRRDGRAPGRCHHRRRLLRHGPSAPST